MPHVSAKRKSSSERHHKLVLKRWKQEEPPPTSPSQEEREANQMSDNSAMVVISLQRLQALLSLVKCVCGNQVTSKVTREYFDCTINLHCEQCKEIMHHSEPKKCKNSDLTEGNVVHVYHSVSEGYGHAGLSRLSAAMGVQELTNYPFTRHAN